jgi:hypothetical protein
MKKLLQFLWLFVYRKSPYYIINEIIHINDYREYHLLRKDYILTCIPILTPIDYTTTGIVLYNNTISEWYKLYNKRLNNKDTIKQITYNKPFT